MNCYHNVIIRCRLHVLDFVSDQHGYLSKDVVNPTIQISTLISAVSLTLWLGSCHIIYHTVSETLQTISYHFFQWDFLPVTPYSLLISLLLLVVSFSSRRFERGHCIPWGSQYSLATIVSSNDIKLILDLDLMVNALIRRAFYWVDLEGGSFRLRRTPALNTWVEVPCEWHLFHIPVICVTLDGNFNKLTAYFQLISTSRGFWKEI